MRWTALLLIVSFTAYGADHTVCASGCDYTSPWTAYTAASCGDTITLTAGETFTPGPVTLAKKAGCQQWITFRSSKAWMLPAGYRPATGDSRLAILSFSTNAAQISTDTSEPTWSQSCWASQLVGNTVTIGYLHSPSTPCEARLRDGTLYHSEAPVCTVTFTGTAVATSGSADNYGTGLRVGLGNDGVCYISHKSDISEGTHFTCTNCDGTGNRDTWIHYNTPDDTISLANISYGTDGLPIAVVNRRVFLHGPQANYTDIGGLYPGLYANTYKGPADGIGYIRWEGIQFQNTATTGVYYGGIFIDDGYYDYRYVPHHLEWDKDVFTTPKATREYLGFIRIFHCDNCKITNTRFENFNANTSYVETQPLYLNGGHGSIYMENVSTDGGTENFLSGGNNAVTVGVPRITLRRSLFRKRLEQYPRLRLVRQTDTAVLALTTTDSATRCNAGSCVAYYEDTAYTYSQDSTVTIAPGQSASLIFGVSSSGVLTAGHNSGANVTCTGDITCLTGVTSRSDMATYAILYERSATSGAWASSNTWSYGNFYFKNLFELKTGKDILFEGNVLRNYWASGGQYQPLGFTPRNQTGLDTFSRIGVLTLRRNKLYNVHSGFNSLGYDDMGWNTRAWGYVIEDNITDVKRANWGATSKGGICWYFNDGGIDAVIRHNTCNADYTFFNHEVASTTLSYFLLKDNLMIWPNAWFLGGINGQGLTAGWTNVRKSDWTPSSSYGYIGPTSEFRGNLVMSEGTVSATGFNSWTDSASYNFTGNQRGQSLTLTDHFTSYEASMTASTDWRLKATSPYSVHCASGCDTQLVTTDGRDPGADVDLVETYTDGVEEGYPPLAQRWGVRVIRNGTGATILCASAATMTVKVSTHQNMKTANIVTSTNTPTSDNGGHKSFSITGLTAGTSYWYTISDGTKTVKGTL